jgi:hypothetical protein
MTASPTRRSEAIDRRVVNALRRGLVLLVAAVALPAFGEADGPDSFRVVNVAPDDVLNVRAQPRADAARLGEIPPGADGVRNLGCQGGLGYAEWAEATPSERKAAERRRWCRVSWRGVEGWVSARHLAEGSGPGTASDDAAAAPEEGGPRLWEVKGASDAVELRETPSTNGRSLVRYARGTLVSNLGCRRAESRVWCDVQELGGGPRGFVAFDDLTPALSPDGAIATGPDDSALRAGRGEFDATGSLACAQHRGQPMRECAFGVARAGGGWATVVVTLAGGRKRSLYFANGRPIGTDTGEADPTGEFRASREGDLNFIRVGDERYEIPDAVAMGG